MSNVIRFLELMGRTQHLRHTSRAALYEALTEYRVELETQWAILRGDASRLSSLLGARTQMVCAILAPESDVDEGVHGSEKISKAA